MHRPSDYPSALLWLLDETHVTVTAATAIAILWTRNAHCAWFAAGAVGSTVITRIIKRTIRQPRPPPPPPSTKPAPVRPKRTYGMPSTHSTALGFYFAYMWPLLPLVSSAVWGERVAVAAITALTLWSRVELGYHTVPQVVVGTTVGVVCAFGWKSLWDAYPMVGGQLQMLMDAVFDKVFSLF
ncbi:hypothetical protein CC85DRAFT_284742 [Cutaneotrichosporon oleaginosum]|uniref:Phosphatidic acid phosphatase type 2/haloperoxidase domain-containing protein n=1 Tax=Cutaneotrichosporon oleaginosum TaxID=879819 RepID=A0A0J0XQ39_9TREE|nr:uncharacterized protein CC85DRAFT_284742 [Cutaneotrichosporon oleaginosum]KLT43187.1 hypothetical protein CC85DRAFT_284742 [Cutaneotrichosporon oleaginosum]TXT09869.1 hypothetical protein COLE_03803 [Cutaneotrichosporon oleaginosum]